MHTTMPLHFKIIGALYGCNLDGKRRQKTAFEIKAWGKIPYGDWLSATPAGGYVDNSNPIPDRTDNIFLLGGGDNRVFDEFKLQTIKVGQVL